MPRLVTVSRPPTLWRSRAAVIAACAIAFLATIFAYSAHAWLDVLTVLCREGLIALCWVVAATQLGALFLPNLRGQHTAALLVASSAGLGLGLFSLSILGLGLAGLLNGVTVILLPVASVFAWIVHLVFRVGNLALDPLAEKLESWLRTPTRWAWSWILLMPFLGMSVVGATVPPGVLWPDDPHPYDVMEYHLQVPREWYEARRIVPLKHNIYCFLPFNVEMHYLAAMHLRGGPWAGMYLCQLMSLSYAVLSVVAVYGGVRAAVATAGLQPSGPVADGNPDDGRAGATIAGLAAGSVPWITMLGCVAYNDGALVAYTALTGAWILLALVSGNGRTRYLAVAGTMAGLACGTKYTAVPILIMGAGAIALLSCIVQALRIRQWLYGWLPGMGLYAVCALLMCGPWLGRNWVWTGNPVFPQAMRLLGTGHLTEQQVERWERAHRASEEDRPLWRRLSALGHRVLWDWRYAYLLIPAGIIGSCLGRPRPAACVLGLMLMGLTGFWLLGTHLQSRFFVMGIPLAGMLLGCVSCRPVLLTIGAGVAAMILPSWLRLDAALMGDARGNGLRAMRDSGAIGLEDLAVFLPEPVGSQVSRGTPIALIGDARAFWYLMPMAKLQYRTVFDVHVRPGQDLVDAWLGEDCDSLRQTHTVVIDSAELRRFARSYAHIPLPDRLRTGELVILPVRPAGPGP